MESNCEIKKQPHGKLFELHTAATAFPIGNIDALLESVKISGQQQPVVVYQGKILDGQRRQLVCDKLRRELLYVEPADLGGLSPVEYVIAKNQNRDLTKSQKSLIAGRHRKEFEEARGENSHPGNKTRDLLGKLFGVDGSTVDDACHVLSKGQAKLIEAVDAGKLAISAARKLIALSSRDQTKAGEAALKGEKKTLRELQAKTRSTKSLKDGRKEEVPAGLVPVFETGALLASHVTKIQDLITWLQSGGDTVAHVTGAVDTAALQKFANSLAARRPWALCIRCHGAAGGCNVCAQAGWQTEAGYKKSEQQSLEDLNNRCEPKPTPKTNTASEL